jgi:hypothetical protein
VRIPNPSVAHSRSRLKGRFRGMTDNSNAARILGQNDFPAQTGSGREY